MRFESSGIVKPLSNWRRVILNCFGLQVKNAVDAETDDELFFLRLDVNVRATHLVAVRDDRVDEFDERRIGVHFWKLLTDRRGSFLVEDSSFALLIAIAALALLAHTPIQPE